MKKSILLALAAFSVNALVAQNTTPTQTPPATQQKRTQETATRHTTTIQPEVKVPDNINQRFITDHPEMKSTWSHTGTHYRAEYSDNNSRLKRAVLYDQNGNPVGKERELGMGEYPRPINDYYSSNYPNEQYRVWTNEDNTGKRNYYITGKSEIIWFDDQGNYTRKVPVGSLGNDKESDIPTE